MDLFSLERNAKLATYMSPIRSQCLGKWKSSPVLEESICLRVSTNKPNKGMSEQNQRT